MSFAARFKGMCPACDEPIEVGDWVDFPDIEGRVIHSDCDETNSVERKPAPVCDICWLEKPCICD